MSNITPGSPDPSMSSTHDRRTTMQSKAERIRVALSEVRGVAGLGAMVREIESILAEPDPPASDAGTDIMAMLEHRCNVWTAGHVDRVASGDPSEPVWRGASAALESCRDDAREYLARHPSRRSSLTPVTDTLSAAAEMVASVPAMVVDLRCEEPGCIHGTIAGGSLWAARECPRCKGNGTRPVVVVELKEELKSAVRTADFDEVQFQERDDDNYVSAELNWAASLRDLGVVAAPLVLDAYRAQHPQPRGRGVMAYECVGCGRVIPIDETRLWTPFGDQCLNQGCKWPQEVVDWMREREAERNLPTPPAQEAPTQPEDPRAAAQDVRRGDALNRDEAVIYLDGVRDGKAIGLRQLRLRVVAYRERPMPPNAAKTWKPEILRLRQYDRVMATNDILAIIDHCIAKAERPHEHGERT